MPDSNGLAVLFRYLYSQTMSSCCHLDLPAYQVLSCLLPVGIR